MLWEYVGRNMCDSQITLDVSAIMLIHLADAPRGEWLQVTIRGTDVSWERTEQTAAVPDPETEP